jgi:DNA-binding response OmpR family regulator
LRETGVAVGGSALAGERILSIAFDPVLLTLRELLLQDAGYKVVSALGSESGRNAALAGAFELFLVGYAPSRREQREVIQWLRREWPNVPIAALRRSVYERIPEADCVADVHEPSEWLKAVEDCIAMQ